jgi:hypothetical protein
MGRALAVLSLWSQGPAPPVLPRWIRPQWNPPPRPSSVQIVPRADRCGECNVRCSYPEGEVAELKPSDTRALSLGVQVNRWTKTPLSPESI